MSDAGGALERGARLFDAGRYFEAHEAWEEGWRAVARSSNVSRLLQGLAQCAAAAHKLEQGGLRGARSLAVKGTRLVESATEIEEVHALELRLDAFVGRMREVFESEAPMLSALPRLLPSDGLEHDPSRP